MDPACEPPNVAVRAAVADLTRITARSEIARVIALHGLVLLVVAASLVRVVLVPEALHFHPKWFALSLPVFAYAAVMVVRLRRIEAAGRKIPRWLLVSNIAVEALLPTAMIVALILTGTLPATAAIASPAILGYAVVLIVSPLRLRPLACLATGAICGLSHALVIYFTGVARGPGPLSGPASVLYGYGVWLIVGGVAAALVARELRRYVVAVLTEALGRRRAEDEIAMAAEIQRGLLPSAPPQIAGFRLAFWSRPADETGGDYYDWQALPDGRIAVSLADVSGHGLGPALMAAFCRAYARAALDGRPDIAAAVRRVNALLSADLPPGRFVTFVVVIVTPGEPEVELVSAGHGPILVHRAAAGTVEEVDAHGCPLGVDADESFEPTGRVRLEPGDAIVLVTDGFFEWRSKASEAYGIRRLREAVLAAPADPAETIAALRRGVEAFTAGATQSDDLTAVVIRYAGE